MSSPDSELALRARQGDRAALDALFRRHAEAILTHAKFKIQPKWSAHLTPEDVLQITCIDAVRSIHTFVPRTEGSFLQWLKRLADNNIIDAVRGLEAEERRLPRSVVVRFGCEADASVSLLHSLVPDQTRTTPASAMGVDESRRVLEWALAQLPNDHRRIVEWYDLEGRSIASIAAEMGKTAGAAYMLRTRAHERIREILAKKTPEFFTNP